MRKLSNRSLAEIPVWRDVPHPEQERFATPVERVDSGNINFMLDYLCFACKRVEPGGSTGLDLCPLTANATDVAAKGQ